MITIKTLKIIMVHKLEVFPEASRRLLQEQCYGMCLVLYMINISFIRFSVLKSPWCSSTPWWLRDCKPEFIQHVVSTKHTPGRRRSKVLGNVLKPEQKKISIQTGTEKALRFVYQLALSIAIFQACSPHWSDDRCWLQAQGRTRWYPTWTFCPMLICRKF